MDHAAADGRAARTAAEDDEVYDDLYGRHVLQGGVRPVHLLHRQQRMGVHGTADAAQAEAGGAAGGEQTGRPGTSATAEVSERGRRGYRERDVCVAILPGGAARQRE